MTDCNCELLNIIDEEAFNTKAIQELCSIVNRSEDTTFLRMVDQTSEGDVQFVRTSVGDFLLDGVTSYTPTGEVKPYKRTTSEEWVEIERCRFDGNTYVDTGYLIEQGGIIEATWAIPNYAYSSTNKYFCGAIKGTASTVGADRWYALYNSGTSSNKRKSSYRGSSLTNIIESDYPDYTHNKKARFRRTNTYFSCYQEIDGVDTQIFLVNASGSNVKSTIPCYIGAVNLNGTATAGYSTAYNLWFYEFEHFDDEDGTYVDIVPVKNTATGVIALKDKIAGTIMLPQKIDPSLSYGGVLYETPRVTQNYTVLDHCYFDNSPVQLGFKLSDTTTRLDVSFTGANYNWVLGARDYQTSTDRFTIQINGATIGLNTAAGTTSTTISSASSRVDFSCDGSTITIINNGNTYTTEFSQGFPNGKRELALGAMINGTTISTSNNLKGYFWGLKVYEGNVLTHNIIPIKNSNNVVCLYDTVAGGAYKYPLTGTLQVDQPVALMMSAPKTFSLMSESKEPDEFREIDDYEPNNEEEE